MSPADFDVCAVKMKKEICCITCKLFTGKLETVCFAKVYERKFLYANLYAFILLEFSCLCKVLLACHHFVI
jgi:hypothetical protein